GASSRAASAPSPPPAMGAWMTSSSGRTRLQPLTMAAATPTESSAPPNESGAITTRRGRGGIGPDDRSAAGHPPPRSAARSAVQDHIAGGQRARCEGDGAGHLQEQFGIHVIRAIAGSVVARIHELSRLATEALYLVIGLDHVRAREQAACRDVGLREAEMVRSTAEVEH